MDKNNRPWFVKSQTECNVSAHNEYDDVYKYNAYVIKKAKQKLSVCNVLFRGMILYSEKNYC